MSLEQSIHTFLSDETAITSIVSNRIWRNHRQSPSLPCIVFSSPTEKPVQQIDKTTDVTTVTVQFNAFSTNDDDTIALVDALRELLNGFSGGMDATSIINIKLRGTHDLSMAPPDGSGAWLYQRVADFTFKIRR